MINPCVLITSCSEYKGENIVKDILQEEKLPDAEKILENIVSYKWSIDTKYYTADVNLCLTKERTIGDQDFAESVQAFITYFDPEEEKTFSQMKLWKPFLDQIEPEIKMLVCTRCTEKSSVSRLTVQKWCIDNEFELVELDPEQESEGEYEDDFVESNGIKRIIQALHAHTWSNLVLKDNRLSVSPYIRQLMQEEHSRKSSSQSIPVENSIGDSDTCETVNQSADEFQEFQSHADNIAGAEATDPEAINVTKDAIQSQNSQTEDTGKAESTVGATKEDVTTEKETQEKEQLKNQNKTEVLDSMLPAEDQTMFEALGNEDPNGESFEKLFEKFASMKQKAGTLPLEERKKYAENVAIAFWKAMGGDEDEIGDLDSD